MASIVEPDATASFIERWQSSGAAERANYQLFLSELCDLLGVPRPNPTVPDHSKNSYVFERAVPFHNGDGTTSFGRIDLYKNGCFVLEAKQGSDQIAPATPTRTHDAAPQFAKVPAGTKLCSPRAIRPSAMPKQFPTAGRRS